LAQDINSKGASPFRKFFAGFFGSLFAMLAPGAVASIAVGILYGKPDMSNDILGCMMIFSILGAVIAIAVGCGMIGLGAPSRRRRHISISRTLFRTVMGGILLRTALAGLGYLLALLIPPGTDDSNCIAVHGGATRLSGGADLAICGEFGGLGRRSATPAGSTWSTINPQGACLWFVLRLCAVCFC